MILIKKSSGNESLQKITNITEKNPFIPPWLNKLRRIKKVNCIKIDLGRKKSENKKI